MNDYIQGWIMGAITTAIISYGLFMVWAMMR